MDTQIALFGYSLSLIELLGAVTGIIYLVLEYRANRWLWLFAVLMPLFYIYINFKSGIYANGLLNVYYLVVSVYGGISWLRTADKSDAGAEEKHLQSMPRRLVLPVVAAVVLLTVALSLTLKALGESQVAWIDGFTSALGVVAILLMVKKYYQQWICWLVVNPLMVAMYLLSGNYPSAVMYVCYCVFSVLGFLHWKRMYEEYGKEKKGKRDE